MNYYSEQSTIQIPNTNQEIPYVKALNQDIECTVVSSIFVTFGSDFIYRQFYNWKSGPFLFYGASRCNLGLD